MRIFRQDRFSKHSRHTEAIASSVIEALAALALLLLLVLSFTQVIGTYKNSLEQTRNAVEKIFIKNNNKAISAWTHYANDE